MQVVPPVFLSFSFLVSCSAAFDSLLSPTLSSSHSWLLAFVRSLAFTHSPPHTHSTGPKKGASTYFAPQPRPPFPETSVSAQVREFVTHIGELTYAQLPIQTHKHMMVSAFPDGSISQGLTGIRFPVFGPASKNWQSLRLFLHLPPHP